MDTPLTEDGFYAASVARNIAVGRGITADGLTRTNGFQPLFTFLSALMCFFAGGERVLSLRFVIGFQCLVFLGTALGVGGVVSAFLRPDDPGGRKHLFLLTAFCYLAFVANLMFSLNGLETGLLLLLLALCWLHYQRGDLSTWRGSVILGLILGLLVLARVDAAFLVLILCLDRLLSGQGGPLGRRVAQASVVGGTALCLSLPWWAYNLVYFGALEPTSGRAQQLVAFVPDRLAQAFWSLLQVANPWLYFGYFDSTVTRLCYLASSLAFGGVLYWSFVAKPAGWRAWAAGGGRSVQSRTLRFGLYLCAHVLALAIWYVASSWATHMYPRYLAPLALPATMLAAAALWRISATSRRVGNTLTLALGAPALLVLVLLQSGGVFRGNPMYREQLQLVREWAPPEDTVAAAQSGTLGYFREGVLNLDGKVNAEVLRYQGRMWSYLCAARVDWLCDEPVYLAQRLGGDPLEYGWTQVARRGLFTLYRRGEACNR